MHATGMYQLIAWVCKWVASGERNSNVTLSCSILAYEPHASLQATFGWHALLRSWLTSALLTVIQRNLSHYMIHDY